MIIVRKSLIVEMDIWTVDRGGYSIDKTVLYTYYIVDLLHSSRPAYSKVNLIHVFYL